MSKLNEVEIVWDKYREGQKAHHRAIPNYTAKLAEQIVNHCALIAAQVDGEDTAGRQKLKLMEPADVAKRACDIAENMVAIFDARGWVIEFPPMPAEEAEKQSDANPGHPA